MNRVAFIAVLFTPRVKRHPEFSLASTAYTLDVKYHTNSAMF